MTRTATHFRSRVDAVKAAREFIWGTEFVRDCEFLDPKRAPGFFTYVDHCPECIVTAQVNLDLIAIRFDHYGRHTVTVLGKVA